MFPQSEHLEDCLPCLTVDLRFRWEHFETYRRATGIKPKKDAITAKAACFAQRVLLVFLILF